MESDLLINDEERNGCSDCLHDSNDDDDDNESDFQEEEIELFSSAKCLFCDSTFPNPTEVFSHCQSSHGCYILEVIKSWQMDCLIYIRFINYVRREQIEASNIPLRSHLEQAAPWQNDTYLQPVIDDDGLLQFDVDNFLSGETESMPQSLENCNITCSDTKIMEGSTSEDMVIYWQQRALAAEQALEQATEAMEKMRTVSRQLFIAEESNYSNRPAESMLQTVPPDTDAIYFDSYSHYGIHQEMLQDSSRTSTYKACFYENKDMFQGKTVLDVGCGTGILCMFAAHSGAQSVIGVEMSEIIYQAMDIVRENAVDNKISLIKGRVEDVNLGVEKVDVIVSEWMGYFLLFESMLDSVIYARDHYLKPGGLVLPNLVSLHIVGVDSSDLNWRSLEFWNDVHGFRMTCMKNCVLRETKVSLVSTGSLITSSAVIKELDTSVCTVSDLDFESAFELTAVKDGDMAAVAGYFDVFFSNLPHQVSFSTGPHAEATHWQQTVFLLPEVIHLNSGQVLKCHLKCCKNRKDPRSLCVTIRIDSHKYIYSVD